MPEPLVYMAPLWLHNRAIVRKLSSGEEFVVRRYRSGATAGGSTLELVPVGTPKQAWDRSALLVNVAILLTDYESTGKVAPITSAPF